MQLPENWCDVVTAWCEGDYPGSDVLYSLELFQVFEFEYNIVIVVIYNVAIIRSQEM